MKKYMPPASVLFGLVFLLLVSSAFYGDRTPDSFLWAETFNAIQPLGGSLAIFVYSLLGMLLVVIAAALLILVFSLLSQYEDWRKRR